MLNRKILLIGILPITCLLQALPTLDHVSHGNAELTTQGSELLIEASDKAILNYRNFDLQSHEVVRFQMQESSHRVLNRIHSENPSQIDGKLFSNGIVYLMNPAGIVFGPNCIVNVAALYAAAAHLSDQDFIQGIDHFNDVKGVIELYGTLSAQEVALIGKSVVQKGEVLADEGRILYATAEHIYLGREEGHLFVKCPREGLQEGPTFFERGEPEALLLHHGGVSRAKNIHLYGEKDSLVQVSGMLDASQKLEGGKVVLQGEAISLEGAVIDASGAMRGGVVHVGGGKHGEGLFPRAQATLCDENTHIYADATENGNGGEIVIWADRVTSFDAKLSVRGGPEGGDGGFVETSSGRHFRGIAGKIDVSAENGNGGHWELDPHSITIRPGANVPGGLTLADLNDGTTNDYIADPSLLESAVGSFTLGATVPNPVGGDNTFISLGDSMGASSATVNITNAGVGVVISTVNGVGNGVFYANGSFTTTGQLTIHAPVLLKGPTTFASTAAGVNFDFTIDSDPSTPNQNLTVAAPGAILFGGVDPGTIGGQNPLGTLTVTTSNAIQFNSDVHTTGDILLTSNVVTLKNNCTFSSTGGQIDFTGSVGSDAPATPRNLTLSAAGDISFHNFVGLVPLGDLLIQNVNNFTLFNQTNPAAPNYTMRVGSFTQLAGTGNTEFKGPLLTTGAPIPLAAGNPPTPPVDGGNVSITTDGQINFYYLVQQGGGPALTPVLAPAPGDLNVFKSVITTTGGRQSSSDSVNPNTNGPDGLSGGSVTLNGSSINLLGIYAGGTPAFPGTSGTGGSGGTVSITSTNGTFLRGPIFATGGAGAGGGAQDFPVLVFDGQNLDTQGVGSPGDITINGPLTLGFNGVVLRGGNITIGDIQSEARNLFAIDASSGSQVNLGALDNLSYFVVDYAKQLVVSGATDAEGVALFNAGSGKITFKSPVVSTDIQAIANRFCVVFKKRYAAATTTFLNCGCEPSPSPGGGPAALRPRGRGFAGAWDPFVDIFYPPWEVFSNDDSYLIVPEDEIRWKY
jgi:filamentous hemagglutinin family protein